jgi:hypothetical protein
MGLKNAVAVVRQALASFSRSIAPALMAARGHPLLGDVPLLTVCGRRTWD